MSMTITETPPDDLPTTAEAAAVVRDMLNAGHPAQEINTELTRRWPVMDAYTGVAGAAQWLGITRQSIYSERSRKRTDGTPRWPAPDKVINRSPFWTWRTLAWHAATMPQGLRKIPDN